MGWNRYGFKPYVPVAQRRAQAAREVAKRIQKGQKVSPVRIEGRQIASTFWGRAWCDNLESYSDYENRLPRGRTYARNGSIIDLQIEKGRIKALVSGSELYEIQIDVTPLPAPDWLALKKKCAGQVGSLVELLQGKLSKGVMELVTDRQKGLFPSPGEIKLRCSCPDYAGLCKHLAAVMYGVGNRLDSSPELLFLLRGVDHTELIEQAIPAAPRKSSRGARTIASSDLGDVFGIEIDVDAPPAEPAKPKTRKTTASKTPAKPAVSKQTAAVKPANTAKKTAAAKKTTPAKPAAVSKRTAAVKPAADAKKTTTAKKSAATKSAAVSKQTAAVKPAPAAKKSTASKSANAAKKSTATKPAAVSETMTVARPSKPKKAATPRKAKG